MIDFHAHVLPGIDDGSQGIQESIQMLRLSGEMGVDTIVATPHYYGERKSISEFLAKRKSVFNELMEACEADAGMPEITLGAEVKFFSGMSREPDIASLCIGDTSFILLEMPFQPWSRRTLNEVRSLSAVCGLSPIIAHIERYFSIQSGDTIKALMDMEVLIQINGSFLINALTRRRALKLFRENRAHILASDCHNMDSRRPNLGIAYKVLERKLGRMKIAQLNGLGRYILGSGRA